jgi:hypothetical protein
MLKGLSKIKLDNAGNPGEVLLPQGFIEAIASFKSGNLLFGERALADLPGTAGDLVHEDKGKYRQNKENASQPD